MDYETKQILNDQQLLKEVTNHQGWDIARKMLIDKIDFLQNAFNIETSSAESMLIDLQARKKAMEILFDFLREVEGAKNVVNENKERESFVINLD